VNTSLEKAKSYFEIGLAFLKKKDFLNAEINLKNAFLLAPDRPSILINLSAVYIELRIWNKARAICEDLLKIDPNNFEGHLNMGICLAKDNQKQKSLDHLKKALQIEPNSPTAWVNTGNIQQELGQLSEAIQSFETALLLKPNTEEALIGRSNAYIEEKQFDLALADLDRALEINPNNPQAKWNKALSLLRLGNFLEGWRLYEERWNVPGLREHHKHFPMPLWLGGHPLNGKTILVRAEQGYGDTIQFSRYIPLLENLGANVVLEAPKILLELLQSISKKIEVIGIDSELLNAPNNKIDYYCPIMSLALAFQTTLETIPQNIPYLYASEARTSFWKNNLDSITQLKRPQTTRPFRIGITWFGSGKYADQKNTKRDISFPEICKLIKQFESEPIEFHAIQKDFQLTSEVADLEPNNLFIHDKNLLNFADTAALIDQMNLVISIDTATAHLSGALAKETLLLLPDPPDFMSLIDRSDSPWYPNTKIIRQQERGNWDFVLHRASEEIAHALLRHTGQNK
jgi:Tfp pilus assembly protein PilF